MNQQEFDQWEEFLDPYIQAVGELKIKLRGVRKQFRKQGQHSPIEFVTGRVKSVDSILEKVDRLRLKEQEENQPTGFPLTGPVEKTEVIGRIEDIAGLRVMAQFVDDVYKVADLLRNRGDMKLVLEKDYIKGMKESGYRSYHMIVDYPVETIKGRQVIQVEIQIRTLSMNFWATIEHSLNYKYQGNFPADIKKRLEVTAKIAQELDKEMGKIRDDIREAQLLFDPVVGGVSDGVGNSDDTDDLYR